jgi:hypothetical protein
MRLKRRLLLLEKALPAPEEPPAEQEAIDWPLVTEALLSDSAGEGLDAPSLAALQRLRPYAEVFRSFGDSMDERQRQGGA